MYRIILDDNTVIGNYSDKKSPMQVAKAIMKITYIDSGRMDADTHFYNTRTNRKYTYRANIDILDEPEEIEINGKKFYKKYNIRAFRI